MGGTEDCLETQTVFLGSEQCPNSSRGATCFLLPASRLARAPHVVAAARSGWNFRIQSYMATLESKFTDAKTDCSALARAGEER